MPSIKPITLFSVALLLFAGNLAAQSFTIERAVIAPGGGHATGDDWTLDATVAQTATGPVEGGSFALYAGFWGTELSGAPQSDVIFSAGFEDTP